MYERVIAFARETPWAIRAETLQTIREVLAKRSNGERFSAEEIQERIGDRAERDDAVVEHPITSDPDATYCPEREPQAAIPRSTPTSGGTVAVLPLMGIIVPRGNMLTQMSGAASLEAFRTRFRSALDNDTIKSIVLDVDSPGGSVYGVDEMASEIFRARDRKPILAVANAQAASAAYYIASAADELWVTPSGEAGSIGVYALHEDDSRMLDAEGVTITAIQYGENKTEGAWWAPLDDEARATMQRRVNQYGEMFDNAVARQRNVTVNTVRADFGQGRMFGAKEAVRLGMADRVGTLDEALARLGAGPGGQRRAINAQDPGEVERERAKWAFA